MKKVNYIRYQKYELISTFLGVMVWVSLGTFSIITKGLLDIDIITFMEATIFIVSILGTHMAFRNCGDYKFYILYNIIIETLFLATILYLVYIDSKFIGISIYLVIILGRMVQPIINEKARTIEDTLFKKNSEKRLLSGLRKKDGYITNIAGTLGSLIAIFFISILNIDIYTFAIYMLCLNIIQNMFDYYKWWIYLR